MLRAMYLFLCVTMLSATAIAGADGASINPYREKASVAFRMPPSSFIDLGPFNMKDAHIIAVKGDLSHIALVDINGRMAIGTLIDAHGNNKNAQVMNKVRRDVISRLTSKNALTVGHGKNHIVIFSDPDCPACRSFEHMLAMNKDIQNQLTITYAFIPLRQLHPKSARHIQSIWCSKDRKAVLYSLMLNNIEPSMPVPGCRYPQTDIESMANEIGLKGTPTIIGPNGSLIPFIGDTKKLMDLIKDAQLG